LSNGCNSFRKRSLLFLVGLLFSFCPLSAATASSQKGMAGFAGIEYAGSSQISRSELEKYLGLKPGARLEQIARAVDRLNQKLEERHISSYVEIVQGSTEQIFVAVSVTDSSTDVAAPTRHLRNPRHVALSTEKPFLLLDDLNARLEKLTDEGRPWSEQMRSGLKYFTDEPANQIVEQMVRLVPYMRNEVIAVTESDPDNNRRRRAIELLNFAGSVPDTSRRIMPALDDADPGVRAATARYLFSRLELLPDDFPFDQLVESFSRLLNRPTHQDRSKALYCLYALCSQRPQLITNAKVFDEDKVKQIASTSIIPSIKGAADQLIARFNNPPRIPQHITGGQTGGMDASGF